MGTSLDELHQQLIAQAIRFAESGATPVTPRLAATVLLLRPAASGFEVYLLRRRSSMAFASGMYVFPGGSVDSADYAGALAGDWAVRLGQPEETAAAVVRAAVREVAEETGVRVSPAELRPWGRWITPEFEPRRYDTYFFVAALPEGAAADNVSTEADRAEWLTPAEALARVESGEILMLPPTVLTLEEVGAFDRVEAVLAAADSRDVAAPVLPRLRRNPDGSAELAYD